MMDDNELVYGSSEGVDKRIAEMKALGADTIRVSVFWRIVAPAPEAQERPSFGAAGAASPAGYPAARWERYDRIVSLARKHGIRVLFNITSPAPSWATGKPDDDTREDVFEPDAGDFKNFVAAVGTRYSGSYTDERPAPPPRGLFDPPAAPEEPTALIPRVDYWSVWNEPNFPSWLGPQRRLASSRGRSIGPAESSKIYRRLVGAAYAALEETGHGSDLILIGETAPRGFRRKEPAFAVRPLEFVRELYCLNTRLRPYQGDSAKARDCPQDNAARQRFVTQHPALFRMSGWAHHPYYLDGPPGASDVERDNAPLGDLQRLISTLDRAQRVWGQSRRPRIFITEFGYQTDPPDPVIGVPWSQQAAYLNEADYIAYRNPRVASVAQFLLVDDGPRNEFAANDPRHFGTFQSGLITTEGKKKKSYDSYQLSIHADPPKPRKGARLTVYGQHRAAANGTQLTAELQFQSGGRGPFKTVASQPVSNLRGFAIFQLAATSRGSFRIAWRGAAGARTQHTRPVKIAVSRSKKPAPAPAPALSPSR